MTTPPDTHSGRAGRPRRFRRPWQRLLTGVLVALAIALALEALLRIGAAVTDLAEPPALRWHRPSATLGWEPQPGYDGAIYGTTRRYAEDGLLAVDSLKLREHPDRPRVFALGDSTTFGFDVATEQTWCERLQRALGEQANVINLGVLGYTSDQGVRLLENKVLGMRPSVVVVCFNYNDRRYVMAPDVPDSAERFAAIWRTQRWRAVTRHLYLARLLAWLMRRPLDVSETGEDILALPSRQTNQLRVDVMTLAPRVAPEGYRERLRRMVELARGVGARVVFLLQQDNPTSTEELEHGLRLVATDQIDAALQSLEQTVRSGDVHRVQARIELARLYKRLGRTADFDRIRILRNPDYSQHGGLPIRPASEYGDIMAEVAAELGVALVDVRPILVRQPDVYIDFVHYGARGHALVAEALDPVVAQLLNDNDNTHKE